MTDKFSKKKRSEIMRAIKSRDSLMEREIRKALNRLGLRYEKNVRKLKGKPDIVFKKKKVAIFLDSCFWHGCHYHFRMPATNLKYWREKIARNKKRDKEIDREYKNLGWTVLRFWEHQIKKDPQRAIKKIEKTIKDRSSKKSF